MLSSCAQARFVKRLSGLLSSPMVTDGIVARWMSYLQQMDSSLASQVIPLPVCLLQLLINRWSLLEASDRVYIMLLSMRLSTGEQIRHCDYYSCSCMFSWVGQWYLNIKFKFS